MTETQRDWADIGERALWTLLQAGVGTYVIVALGLSPEWTVAVAGGLAVIKGMLATKFGNGTAATLPESVERY